MHPTMRIINVAIQVSDNVIKFFVYDPIANATAAIGAEKPTIKLNINPTIKHGYI